MSAHYRCYPMFSKSLHLGCRADTVSRYSLYDEYFLDLVQQGSKVSKDAYDRAQANREPYQGEQTYITDT